MEKCIVALLIIASLLVVMTATASAQQDEEAGPFIPAIASAILPGFGQFLNGEVNKAILHLALDVAIWTTWGLLGYLPGPVPIGYLAGVAALGLRIYSAYDAYTVATERGFFIGLTEETIILSYRSN